MQLNNTRPPHRRQAENDPPDCLAAALAYAARGWAVMPLRGKIPRTPHGLKDATTDPETIKEWHRKWPGANWGIATGEASGIVVLDVDGPAGIATLDALLDEHGHLPETPEAVTGGGGRHVLFRYPAGGVRNSAGKVGDKLDVRGDGGYIVAAPSLHAIGNRYEWIDGLSPDDASLSDAPDWLLAKMRGAPAAPPRPTPRPDLNGHADAAGHWLGKALARCSEGTRNETGLWLAVQLRDAGLSEAEAESVAHEYADRVPGSGYTVSEATASVASAFARPARDPAKGEGHRAGRAVQPGNYFDEHAAGDDAKPAARRAPIIRSFADIERRPIRWLWTNRIARGKLTALVSAPGDGKSTMTCDLAARLSSGSKWPDGDDSAGAADTLLINGEDDPHDQLRPRLEAAGADLSRVALLSGIRVPREDGTDAEQLWQLPDLDVLAAALDARPETAFICIDPLNSFIGGATDAHRDNEVRAVLGPLKKLAEDRGVAVLLVMHHRKGRGRNADEAVMGSRAFTGIVRQVWHVVRDAEDAARRLLLPGKTNICAEGGGLAYSIRGDDHGDPVVAWEADPVEMSADDGLAALAKAERDTGDDEADHRQSKLDLAGNFIADLLLDGPRAWADVATAGRQAGHAGVTLERARGSRRRDVQVRRGRRLVLAEDRRRPRRADGP